MAVIWKETKRDGSVIVTREDVEAGTVELLAEDFVPESRKKAAPGGGGYWIKSRSNGFVGTEADRIKEMKLDAANGVACDYKPMLKANGRMAYQACHRTKGDFIKWMKSRNRVSFDPGDKYPCPSVG